ncbi:MAG: hypothetical protein AAFQ98_17355 [Bacteroidota bacterium]
MLNILMWNFRNLSTRLRRPGTRGLGVIPSTRAFILAQNIQMQANRPDLIILLETGRDAATILGTPFENQLGNQYQIASSPLVSGDGEMYTLLYRTDSPNLAAIPVWSNVGLPDSQDRFRKAAVIRVDTGKGVIHLVVLHATASVSASQRLQWLDTQLFPSLAQNLNLNEPTLFLGDFNFQTKDVQRFLTKAKQQGYTHVGPFSADGEPQSTSVVTWRSTVNKAFMENQPYDMLFAQGWPAATPFQSQTMQVAVPIELTDRLQDIILDRLQRTLDFSVPNGMKPTTKDAATLIGEIQQLQAIDIADLQRVILQNAFPGFQDALTQLGTQAGQDEALAADAQALTAYFQQVQGLANQFFQLLEGSNFKQLNDTAQLDVIATQSSLFVFYGIIAVDYLANRLALSGFPGDATISNALFSAFLSDHLPIQLSVPTNSLPNAPAS